MNFKVDIESVVNRFKLHMGFGSDRQCAEFFGDSQQNFNGKKKRGSILYPILDEALNREIDLNELYYGEEVEMASDSDKILLRQGEDLRALTNEVSRIKREIDSIRKDLSKLLEASAKGRHPRIGAEAKETEGR